MAYCQVCAIEGLFLFCAYSVLSPSHVHAQSSRLEPGSAISALPPDIDLSSDFPSVGYQGNQGSCTAWAVGYGLKSYLERNGRRGHAHGVAGPFSPAFLYNQAHQHDREGKCAGMFVEDAFEFVKNNGIAPLSLMPYDERDCETQPSEIARQQATDFRLGAPQRISGDITFEVKARLASHNPVILVLPLDPAFWDVKDNTYPGTTTGTTAVHAMVIVGYNDARQAVKVLNSWGTSWGVGGYGWIAYSALSRPDTELWVEAKPQIPKPPPGKLGARIQFEHNRPEPNAESSAVLDEIAAALKSRRSLEAIVIAGHADDTGLDWYNIELSQARAIIVRRLLVARGVRAWMFEAHGFGSYCPLDEHSLAANRRVEVAFRAEGKVVGEPLVCRNTIPKRLWPNYWTQAIVRMKTDWNEGGSTYGVVENSKD